MILGVFLAIGESLSDLKSKGQLDRLLNYNILEYSKNFDKVYIFSYQKESIDLPKNCTLIGNNFRLNRYLYAFMLPILNKKYIKKCDVIRGLQMTSGIPAIFSNILFGKKFVFNYGYEYKKVTELEGKRFRAMLIVPLTFLVALAADAIIITSRRFEKNIFPKFNKRKIHLIPNGVDTKLFRPSNRTISSRNLKMLFVGRLEKEKNLKNLIIAISKFNNFRLTIVGQGSLKKEISEIFEKLKIQGNIFEKIEYKDIAAFYREFDIFVLPSYTEGHPKVLLEAQSTGLVTLASKIPGNVDIISESNGILFKPTQNGIKLALEKVRADSKLREELSSAARINAVTNYEISILLKREISLLKSLASK